MLINTILGSCLKTYICKEYKISKKLNTTKLKSIDLNVKKKTINLKPEHQKPKKKIIKLFNLVVRW